MSHRPGYGAVSALAWQPTGNYREAMSTDDAPDADVRPAAPSATAQARQQASLTVAGAREFYDSGATRSIDARLAVLATLDKALRIQRQNLLDAVYRDLRKNPTEATLTELGVLHQEIAHVRKHLEGWARPRSFSPGITLAPASGRLQHEPYGVALVISPWNYPVSLSLAPVVAAIAAGNTVVLKPSELAPATSAALAHLVRTHLDPNWVQVVEGGVDETTALLEERFDVILYTGNGTVGRIVARAAAEHLTPTILELGGKSPVFVDDDVDLATVARIIAWGKFTNAGQTCVAPDYVLARPETLDRLEPHLRRAVRELYGKDPRRSHDYGRIINERHFDRVLGLMDPARCTVGGPEAAARAELYIPPTVMVDVDPSGAVMDEEIFGPVLPLLAVDGPDDAIRMIRAGEKPLTAYVFSSSPEVEEAFAQRTSSGSLAFGLTLAHVGSTTMPFGGVGESGMGAYHGRAGFEAFGHRKPVVSKPVRFTTLSMVFPPYGPLKRWLIPRLFG